MTFATKRVLFPNYPVELVHCCDLHGLRPREEIDELHPKQTSRPEYDARRRANRVYKCKDCDAVFSGHGAKYTAETHTFWTQHKVIKGGITEA